MKFVLNIYDHDVIMHIKLHQGDISNRGVRSYCPLIAKFQCFFPFSAITL